MVTIRLLGPPAIERDGRPARPPRGRKAWALLAYVLLAARPPSRRHLAELLFADADDPLGALRWTLAELRRALGLPGAFAGDPVVAGLDGVCADLRLVMADVADDQPLPDTDGELLEGLQVPSSPAFESWLLVARHKVAARIEARLREAAVALLAAGHAGEAVGYASRAVARNPLEEGNHELLVRSLAAAGDRMAARRQVAVTTDLFRRELGVDPSPDLHRAADPGPATTAKPWTLPVGVAAAGVDIAGPLTAGPPPARTDAAGPVPARTGSARTGAAGPVPARTGSARTGAAGPVTAGVDATEPAPGRLDAAGPDTVWTVLARRTDAAGPISTVPVSGGADAAAGHGRAAAAGQLAAGRAALLAGAVAEGLRCLRAAAGEAARCGDTALEAQALADLGAALVHAVRGKDEEGAIVLHEALMLADRAGDRATAVTAHRELGYIEVLAGRRQTARLWLTRAADLAGTDQELAPILCVRGIDASDSGDYPAAFTYLEESETLAAACGDHRQRAWSLAMIGRARLLRGEHPLAGKALRHSLEIMREQRWTAFLPLPQALLAELDLATGELESAAERLEQAWTLGCQMGDPCWEGLGARGLGLLHDARGDREGAVKWLDEAGLRCNRVSDRYQWVHAYVLDAMIGAAVGHGDVKRARALLNGLSSLAARCDMPEITVRAHLHRWRLGDEGALVSARLLAAGIDNPALTEALTAR